VVAGGIAVVQAAACDVVARIIVVGLVVFIGRGFHSMDSLPAFHFFFNIFAAAYFVGHADNHIGNLLFGIFQAAACDDMAAVLVVVQFIGVGSKRKQIQQG